MLITGLLVYRILYQDMVGRQFPKWHIASCVYAYMYEYVTVYRSRYVCERKRKSLRKREELRDIEKVRG